MLVTERMVVTAVCVTLAALVIIVGGSILVNEWIWQEQGRVTTWQKHEQPVITPIGIGHVECEPLTSKDYEALFWMGYELSNAMANTKQPLFLQHAFSARPVWHLMMCAAQELKGRQ